jgi:streptogramin lyase
MTKQGVERTEAHRAGVVLGWPAGAGAQTITEFPIPTVGGSPISITTGRDGALWFTERIGNKIGRITTAGVITEFPIPTDSVSLPRGITSGPDGALWFTEGPFRNYRCELRFVA